MPNYNYLSATSEYLRDHGGQGPKCSCGAEMVAEDDHGRFTCFSCGSGRAVGPVPSFRPAIPNSPDTFAGIPQITEEMPDEEKAKVDPLRRMYLKPTSAEAEMFRKMLRREDYMGAMRKVKEERKRANSQ